MNPPIQKILITREQLEKRIHQLADTINRDYRGKELILMAILKGAVVFLADLMKELDLDVKIGFLYLSSYRGDISPQETITTFPLPFPEIIDRNVLVIEDILDTGASLRYALNLCREKNPRTLKTCVLLIKEGIERVDTPPIDYFGFHVPNEFVVGYGLDFQERYRHLPYIAIPEMS